MSLIRPMLPSERVMVTSDWVRSYLGAWRVKGASERLLWHLLWTHVDGLIHPGNTVVYARLGPDCAPLGWACGESDRIHYVYVRHAARRCGIATELVQAVSPDARGYTHEMPAAEWASKHWRLL